MSIIVYSKGSRYTCLILFNIYDDYQKKIERMPNLFLEVQKRRGFGNFNTLTINEYEGKTKSISGKGEYMGLKASTKDKSKPKIINKLHEIKDHKKEYQCYF